MSLTTRCPTCATQFRVVADQLRISDGWVRCGRCGEVFDAQARLQLAPDGPPLADHDASAQPTPPAPWSDGPVHTAPLPARQVEPDAAAHRTPSPLADATVDFELDFDVESPVEPRPAPPVEPRPAPPVEGATDGSFAEAARAGVDIPIDVPAPWAEPAQAPRWPEGYEIDVNSPSPEAVLAGRSAAHEPDEPQADTPPPLPSAEAGDEAAEPLGTGQEVPQGRERNEGPESDRGRATAQAPEPAFVRQARRRAFWRRGSVRVLLGLVALALLGGLAAQVAVQQRDRLAAWQPALRPALLALCQPLGCRILPPRAIESIVIESSSFSREGPQAYRLAFTLRNAGPRPVALPALELTLTDIQEQALVRRVLAPAELSPVAPTLLDAGAEWASSVAMAVDADAGAERIAGYRVLAFYP